MSAPSTPRPCPVCDSVGAREVLYRQRFFGGPLGEGYDVAVCGDCGAGFADGILTQNELDRYYAERSKYTYAHAGGAESPYDFKRFEVIADQIEAHLPSRDARILDIGCATGGLLAVLQQRGYTHLLGSDPSPACAEAARRLHGVEVRTATLAEHAAWADRFDAVLLVGVLEHLREVRDALGTVRALLSPGGVVYCAQPDVEAFAACENAPYQQFSTEHLNYFSNPSLARLMEAVGLVEATSWRWMIAWRAGVTDSVVSGVYRAPSAGSAGMARGHQDESLRQSFRRDTVTRPALAAYLARCEAEDAALRRVIDALVVSGEPILVWGTGTLTRRLLATGALEAAKVRAYVDSDSAGAPRTFAGRPVLAPADLLHRSETIFVASRPFADEIVSKIRNELGLKNRVVLVP